MGYSEIEQKWQKEWEKAKVFETKEDLKKKKCYVLEMYPYPSGTGLHVGHAFNFTIADVYARFKRMNGFSVLYPAGYDSFGLPAENAAIKNKAHPKKFTDDAISYFMSQQKKIGLSYDWSRMIKSHDPNYYKWDQWIFLKMYEKGLVYKKKSPINWCPKCNTVLANEQVHNGKCWRHEDTNVEIKHLEQWFFKTTNYADELYEKADSLNWPERIKAMQKNWIGKSHGTEILFEINGEKWPIFTTRPDTIFGVTFMVVSAQHSRLMELVTKEQKKDVDEFLKRIKSTSEKDMEELEKEGVFTGSYAINPVTKDKVPVYAGNFVVADYGAGMVMAVPAHDQRDFEFAKKYNIPIKVVISPQQFKLDAEKMSRAYTESGTLVNSSEFDGYNNDFAIDKITEYLNKKGLGKKVVNYKLRDWLVSRQRFWGTPIPIVYCDKCGIVTVPEKDLPVVLPENMVLTGEKGNPLATNGEFVNTKCPKCNGNAKRETDTMDTFVNSSWYFLRFTDPHNSKEIFDKKKAENWMPIDFYVGGAEHACMHLIYARFYTKFLRDIGLLKFDEPIGKLFNQGMVHGEDGFVMSKSRGNVIDPMDMINQYGADTLRLFIVSVASPDKDFAWSSTGVDSIHKFVKKVYDLKPNGKSSKRLESKMHKAIKDVTNNIDSMKYNVAIINLRKLYDVIESEQAISKQDLESFLKLLHPFCPHLTEELWYNLGNKDFVSLASWPKFDENKIDERAEAMEEIIEDVCLDINNVLKVIKNENPKAITLIVAQDWKYSFIRELKAQLEKTSNPSEIIKSLMQNTELKQYAPLFTKQVPMLANDRSKMPKVVLSSEEEFNAFNEAKQDLEKRYAGTKFTIEKELESKNAKAKLAMPGKPGVFVE